MTVSRAEIIYLLTRCIEKYQQETGMALVPNTNKKNYEPLSILLSEISNRLPETAESMQHIPYTPDAKKHTTEYPFRKYDITGGQIRDAFMGLVANPRPFLVDACYIYLYKVGRQGFELNPVDEQLERKIKAAYLHSDIETLERTNILDDLRRGNYDVLIGINLLREGLDLPEVTLVAILDADKEGFLRSRTSLIQTMGRAARHVSGEVVMYADKITKSMEAAIDEVERRREIQIKFNLDNNITPQKINKPIREKLIDEIIEDKLSKKPKRAKAVNYEALPPKDLERELKKLKEEMNYEAEMLNFEKAAQVRDEIKKIKKLLNLN